MEKVCLDTDVCIAILKKDESVKGMLSSLMRQEIAITAVTRLELGLRETKREEVERFVQGMEVLDFSGHAAEMASDIFMALRKKGRLVEFRDVFIAATCIASGCALATLNRKHFERMPWLELF